MKKLNFYSLLCVVVLFAVGCSENESDYLSAPTGFTARQSGNKVILQWNAVTGATQYQIAKNGLGWLTTSFTSIQDSDPDDGYNYYELIATNGIYHSPSVSTSVNFSSGNSGGGGTGGGGYTEESVSVSITNVSVTSSSVIVKYSVNYSNANVTASGIIYGYEDGMYHSGYVELDGTNLNKLQNSTSGAYTITMTIPSSELVAGKRYEVFAYLNTTKDAYVSSSSYFTTSATTGGGDSGGGTGNLTVNKTNLTGVWTCTFNGGDQYYWVLQSSGTAYSIVDESSYWSTGSYHKFTGTWTVSGSSFTFKQSRHYYYEGGTLTDNESESDTETVTVRTLTSSSFVDGDYNTWTKTTLPSYIKL